MKRPLVILHIATLILGFNITSHAQDTAPAITDFNFLAGYWVGGGLGGKSEEIWMPAADGSMFGIFKQASDTGIVFTEYMEITKVDGEFVLRLKHFNPDFSGWESQDEHVSFPLHSVAPDKAVFGGLSYTVTDRINLRIELRLQESDGSTHTEVFNFIKQDI